MLSQVTTRRLYLSYDVTSAIIAVATSALNTYLSMCVIHMINIILRMESSLSGVLIFEYLCQESFTVLIDCMITISLYRHASSVHCVKLSSDLSLLTSWTSLSSL